MPYGEVALPSTGGFLLGGAIGLFYDWAIAIVVVILVLSLIGVWRLYRGQKTI